MITARMSSISADRIGRMLTRSLRPQLEAALRATGEDGIKQVVANANRTMRSGHHGKGPSLHDEGTYSYEVRMQGEWAARVTGEVTWSFDDRAATKLHVLDGGFRGTSYRFYTDGIQRAIATFRQVGMQRVRMWRG